jgi:hypothetical protein
MKNAKDLVRAAAAAAMVLVAGSIAQAGMVVHYDFNGNALDSSGYGNDATILGTPAFVAGQTDGAIYFNNPAGNVGATQCVTIPNTPSVSGLSDTSFSLAIKYKSTDSTGNNGRLVGGNYPGLEFDYNAGATPEAYGRLNLLIYGHSNGTVDPRAVTTDGNWHWAVLTVDRGGASPIVDYYVDTHLITTSSSTLGPIDFSNISIGRDSGDVTYAARLTTVDDFRLYDTALSATQVANVPEPATLSLLALGGMAILRRRRAAKR